MSFDLFKFQEWPTKTIFVRLLDLFLKKHVSHLQYQTLTNGKGLMSAGIIIFYPTTHNKYQFFSWYISIVSDFASGLLNKSCWLAIGLAFPYCFWKSRFNCKVDENFILSAGTWSGVQAFYRTLLWLKIVKQTNLFLFRDNLSFPRMDKLVSMENLGAQQEEYVKNVVSKLMMFQVRKLTLYSQAMYNIDAIGNLSLTMFHINVNIFTSPMDLGFWLSF